RLIDSRAVVDPKAELAEDVEVGPYAIIGPHVQIDSGTRIDAHAVVRGPSRIGRDNRIFQFAVVGEEPQDKKFRGEDSVFEMGDRNIIREFATLHRGTDDGGGITRIGNDNLIMAYCHIAHDCLVGNDVIFSNNASLAGHVTVGDHAILGGFSLVHQFCRIGDHCFTGFGSVISKDVPPYVRVSGHPAEPHGLNIEGLNRRGFTNEQINALRKAYKLLYKSGLLFDEAKDELKSFCKDAPVIQPFCDFVMADAKRSIIR
ncbi:MAG: acyl-ACP--UDP-N-acetylglucosamine O-acyltransferase, partial [Gammaproteobacteria bacterium]